MRDPSRRVVITGAGLCTNKGHDLELIIEDLRNGRPGSFGTYQAAVDLACRCTLIGTYPGDVSDAALGIKKTTGRFFGRAARLALIAARRAIAQSGCDPRRAGIVAGSGTGDVQTHLDLSRALGDTGDAKRTRPTTIPKLMSSTVSANLANVLGCDGPSFTIAAACAGGAYNIAIASQLIECGHMDLALAGGCDVADPHFYVGFDAMRAYNSEDNDRPARASRPYAADRAGFVFSEGSGMVVLETEASARARRAPVLAVIRGFGMSSDGNGKMVSPSCDGAALAMRNALNHAEVDAKTIDYINTHGTSTPLGDVSEVAAIRSVFEGHRPPYSSTKGYTGHTISGAGAIEAILCATMLQQGWLAPSANATPLDPELLDYPPVCEPTRAAISRAMSNSFGFGGTNVSLIIDRATPN